MKKRLFLFSAFLCFLLFQTSAPAAAEALRCFSFEIDPPSASGGGIVRLEVNAVPTEVTAAGFRLRVSFDEDRLDFLGTETAGAVKSGTMRTNSGAGTVSCVYVCNADKGSAPRLSGNVATFLFQAEPDAEIGKTELTVETDQVCDYNGEPIAETSRVEKLMLKIGAIPSSKACLSALKPSQGTLVPDFSSAVTSYLLPVGSGVGSVEFQADAAENGTVRVSRRTLNAAGRQTQIAITVTSADKLETARYLVNVERASKTEVSGREEKKKEGAARTEKAKESDAPRMGAASKRGSGGEEEEQAFEDRGGQARTEETAAGNAAPLVVVGDRMPSYLFGMLACVLCVTAGVALSLWFQVRPKK